jgi:Lrp/AsnC family leucine-responsive transcriptional regulator
MLLQDAAGREKACPFLLREKCLQGSENGAACGAEFGCLFAVFQHKMPNLALLRILMSPASLDATDLRILKLLQQDSSLSNVELAGKINLSPSPTLARVKNLESRKVISRYVALADPHALGLKVNVFVQVSLEKQESGALARFETAVSHFEEVMEVYLMTGDSDYLLRIVVPDIQALEHFILDHLTRIPGIKNIRSSFALKQVKYKTALPVGDAV